MKRYYIAYGSNLNKGQMKLRCKGAKVVGTSNIKDYELLFKGSGSGNYLTIEKKKGSNVPVAIWEVTERDELNLDVYEGYPKFYYKKDMKLRLNETGKKIVAFVYIMHEERTMGLPSKRYFQICKAGYEYFGLNYKYLVKAYLKSGGFIDYENESMPRMW